MAATKAIAKKAKKATKKTTSTRWPTHSLDYADTKFAVAVGMLARLDVPLRQRLDHARTEFLPAAMMTRDCEDDPLVRKLLALCARMNWNDSPGYRCSEATLRVISDGECQRIAEAIVELHHELRAELHKRQRERAT